MVFSEATPFLFLDDLFIVPLACEDLTVFNLISYHIAAAKFEK